MSDFEISADSSTTLMKPIPPVRKNLADYDGSLPLPIPHPNDSARMPIVTRKREDSNTYGAVNRNQFQPQGNKKNSTRDAYYQIRAFTPSTDEKSKKKRLRVPLVKKERYNPLVNIFGDNFRRLMNTNDPYSLRVDLDIQIRKKNIITFLVAMLGIALMVVENIINWDDEEKEIVSNVYTNGLKFLTSLSTLVLLFLIVDSYRILAFVTTVNYQLSSLHRLSLTLKNHGLRFMMEILTCAWHIPPFVDHMTSGNPDKYGIFMFFRIYLAIKVIRDSSPVFRHRAKILQRMERSRTGTAFDGYLVHIRRFFFHYPGRFVLCILFIIYLVMVFSIYVQEREVQDDFDFDTSLWYTAVTMMTVGYGDVVAKSTLGRICAVTAGVLGIILSSLCVAVTSGFLNLSRRQRFAVDWVSKAFLDQEVENEAARVIQCWWKILMLRKRNELTPYAEYKYGSEIIRSILFLRRYRKEAMFLVKYANDALLLNRLQLEGRYDPVLDRVLRVENAIQSISIDIQNIHDSVVESDPSQDVTKIRVLGGYERPPIRTTRPLSLDNLPNVKDESSVRKRIEYLEEKNDNVVSLIAEQNAALMRVTDMLVALESRMKQA